MTNINTEKTRLYLQDFKFAELFIEELNWSYPAQKTAKKHNHKDLNFVCSAIATLGGAEVYEIITTDGKLPNAKVRNEIAAYIQKSKYENLIIFLDQERSQSVWHWEKIQDKGKASSKKIAREHFYMFGQSGDAMLPKLLGLHIDMAEFDEYGTMSIAKVVDKLKQSLDVERVTKKFFKEYQNLFIEFVKLIEGIDDPNDRHWYASVVLNRLMFIYFLQKKGFIDNKNYDYLTQKLNATRGLVGIANPDQQITNPDQRSSDALVGIANPDQQITNPDQRSSDVLVGICNPDPNSSEFEIRKTETFYSVFLQKLFFEGFALPKDQRSPETTALIGNIKYLNGGLFLKHKIELKYSKINIADHAFQNLFTLFDSFSWSLNDSIGQADNEINPDVLGYIFEKYINQKEFGAYYTRPEITEYLCEQTVNKLIVEELNIPNLSLNELIPKLDAPALYRLVTQTLPNLSLIDPACGSGAFLVAAMKTLINVYQGIIGRIKFSGDKKLTDWLKKIENEHPSLQYYIKKQIITNNLYGVDIMEEATEIAKLRLFLALVASAQHEDELEPLPNIDFNIMPGNSLMGLMRVDSSRFDKSKSKEAAYDLFAVNKAKSYQQLINEKEAAIRAYRNAQNLNATVLQALKESIQDQKTAAYKILNELLLEEFITLGIKYETATWDETKNTAGKTSKRPLTIADIEALEPFHWGYEFSELFTQKNGFDAVIANPPWEVFKPQAKEFFVKYSDLITKNKMNIKDFEKEQAEILQNPQTRSAWLKYQSDFLHVSAYFRTASQFKNQISVVNGKKAGSDINLYKLFTEQSYNLLKNKGYCGMVIPSGIYTDLGTKQLRKMLFEQTNITGLFCLENRKTIFENVDSRFKFVC